MSSTRMSEDFDSLSALAGAIANAMSERHADPSVARDAEARLRAGIAAAAFARSAYEAILAGSAQSPMAAQFIGPARRRTERAVTKLLAEIHILLDPEDASSMAEFVLSMR